MGEIESHLAHPITMALNLEQQKAFDLVKRGENVFITGQAGSGKSHLVHHIADYLAKENKVCHLLAPTGIAASHIHGKTIHRAFKIHPKTDKIEDYTKQRCFVSKETKFMFKETHCIIIDEISMVHYDMFLLIDWILRLCKFSQLPFGGIQMILVGDFCQLPPVVKDQDPELPRFSFQTDLWKKANIIICKLNTNMRVKGTDGNEADSNWFASCLEDLSIGMYTDKVKELMSICSTNQKIPKRHYVSIYSTNDLKSNSNAVQLSKINSPSFTFTSKDSGDLAALKNCLAEEKLVLKVGCPVMLLKNYSEYNVFNGSIGVVKKLTNETVVVKFDSGTYGFAVDTFEMLLRNPRSGKNDVIATRLQIPLVLAWSITVHKSQGMTIDYIEIDCSRIFEYGQLYVAMSRARTWKHLILKNFDKKYIMANPDVVQWTRV